MPHAGIFVVRLNVKLLIAIITYCKTWTEALQVRRNLSPSLVGILFLFTLVSISVSILIFAVFAVLTNITVIVSFADSIANPRFWDQ